MATDEKRKVGRPKMDNPRKKTVTIRVTPEEYDRIAAYAEMHGVTMTEVLLEGLDMVYSKS